MLPKLRTCSCCKGEFPQTTKFFRYDNSPARHGWQSWCVSCYAQKNKEYRARNKATLEAKRQAKHAANPFLKRSVDLRAKLRKTGLTLDEASLHSVIASHRGTCWLCDKVVTGFDMCVDHDHATGRVRGILCRNCNCGLGLAEDKPKIIESLIAYLERAQHA
jgi:hypothetical protein